MKQLYLTIFLSYATSNLFSQDVLILKNGTEINAKVSEITLTEVKYKKSDNLNGTLISISKADVLLIKYENGTKDVFAENNLAEKSTTKQNIHKYTALFYTGLEIPIGGFSQSWEDGGSAAKIGGVIGHEGSVGFDKNNTFHFVYNLNYEYVPYNIIAKLRASPEIAQMFPYIGNNIFPDTLKGRYDLYYFLLGLKATTNNENLKIYGSITAGINSAKLRGDAEDNFISKASTGFSMGVSSGIVIDKRYNIGLRYYFSKQEFEEDGFLQTFEDSQHQISILNLTIGIQF